MARPSGDDWLDDEINQLKKQNVFVLVSLLEDDEIQMLGLAQEKSACLKNDLLYLNFPIKDRDVPGSKDKTQQLIEQLRKLLQSGRSVVVHCRMGIGRSSIIAASLLLDTGLIHDEIITLISKIRGIKVPDTDEQLQWFKRQK